MLTTIIVCVVAGLGAGLVTGLAGMSAAVIVSPMLISLLDMPAYQAVTISLASDVIASAASAYTYGKNGNLDIQNGLVMMAAVLIFTVLGSWLASLVPDVVLGGGSYLITIIMGIRFLVPPSPRPSPPSRTSSPASASCAPSWRASRWGSSAASSARAAA